MKIELHKDANNQCGVYLNDTNYHPAYIRIGNLVSVSGMLGIGADMDTEDNMYSGLPATKRRLWTPVRNMSTGEWKYIYMTSGGTLRGQLQKGGYAINFCYIVAV